MLDNGHFVGWRLDHHQYAPLMRWPNPIEHQTVVASSVHVAAVASIDHVIVIATIVAAIGALVTAGSVFFSAWRLHLRPEVDVSWAYGDPYRSWPKTEILDIHLGDTIRIRVSPTNNGAVTGETTMINFVAADCFVLRMGGRTGKHSGNRIAGRRSGGGVNFVSDHRRFFPNLTWTNDIEMSLDRGSSTPSGLIHELVFEVEDDRLSAAGRRWFRWRTFPLGQPERMSKVWRRMTALPKGDIECSPGLRRTTRFVRVVEPSPSPWATMWRDSKAWTDRWWEKPTIP